MGSTFSGIELGKRSIMAHTDAISTAGHNISNANTEGYSRQRVQMKEFDPLYRPDLERAERAGMIGQGIDVQSINRVRDEMLDQRITAQQNQESYWDTRSKYYTMIEQIYNEPDEVSVRSNMDKFWESWQELSVNPESQAARQAVVTRGESLSRSSTSAPKVPPETDASSRVSAQTSFSYPLLSVRETKSKLRATPPCTRTLPST